MSTLADPCAANERGEVEIALKLLINGIEYLPARSYFIHKINQKFSITLNGTAKLLLRRGDVIHVEISFDNQRIQYLVGNGQISVEKLRLWT
jgi:hypothetical protein